MEIGVLIARVVVGALFAAHGAQKLFGWFGGYGIGGTAGFMGSLRYRNPRMAAISAGIVETSAGIALVAGFLTPLAAAAVIGVMINAIVSAKWSQGLFAGYELDLLYATAAAALAFTGAGRYSVDAALGWNAAGTTWGLVALGLGGAVALAVLGSRVPARALRPTESSSTDDERRAA